MDVSEVYEVRVSLLALEVGDTRHAHKPGDGPAYPALDAPFTDGDSSC